MQSLPIPNVFTFWLPGCAPGLPKQATVLFESHLIIDGYTDLEAIWNDFPESWPILRVLSREPLPLPLDTILYKKAEKDLGSFFIIRVYTCSYTNKISACSWLEDYLSKCMYTDINFGLSKNNLK